MIFKLTLMELIIPYKSKDKIQFSAFNFDEVVTLPEGATHLASNKINKIQSINFKSGISDVGIAIPSRNYIS